MVIFVNRKQRVPDTDIQYRKIESQHADYCIKVCIKDRMDILSTISLINSKGRHVTPGLGHGLPSPQPSTFPRPLVLLQLCGGQPLRPQGH